jgi:hypothetical protein
MQNKSVQWTHMAAFLVSLTGCQGVQPSSGLDQVMRVQGAQLATGRIATARGNAPVQVTAPTSAKSQVFPGQQDVLLTGSVGPEDESGPLASAVAIGIDGQDSYWILPASERDSATSYLMNFRATLTFSPDLDPNQFPIDDNTGTPKLTLLLRAIAQGVMGEARAYDYHLLSAGAPDGVLVFSLSWNAPVDLDLHVVAPLPDGSGETEVWAKNPSALPAQGTAGAPMDAGAREAGGYLDLDSNASCQLDNRVLENVVWTGAPPSGHYIARVDAFSLCGEKSAQWHMTASLKGKLVGDAWGTITAAHAGQSSHGAGAGMTAIEYDVR